MSAAGNFATSRRGGVDDYEMSKIHALRAKGVGIQNIANMMRRPVSTVAEVLAPIRRAVNPNAHLVKPEPIDKGFDWHRPTGGVFTPEVRAILDKIVAEEAYRAYLPEHYIFGYAASRNVVDMRKAAYYRASMATGLTMTALGKYFNRSLTSMTQGIASHIERNRPQLALDCEASGNV